MPAQSFCMDVFSSCITRICIPINAHVFTNNRRHLKKSKSIRMASETNTDCSLSLPSTDHLKDFHHYASLCQNTKLVTIRILRCVTKHERQVGVSVDLGVWKYVCHGFPVIPLFLPEGRSAVDFMCKWIKDTNENN